MLKSGPRAVENWLCTWAPLHVLCSLAQPPGLLHYPQWPRAIPRCLAARPFAPTALSSPTLVLSARQPG